jgi:tetraacyldisaccharide 4'-kinase
VSAILKPAELLYRGVNRARRALYRAGVLRGKRLSKPVISIGNLAAGGAGKTPAVITLCRFLAENGLRVAVLTRGYGRGDASYSGPVVSFDAEKYGDEPVLIRRLTNVDVLVGANRYENARRHDCDVFVLDDGFQHLQLRRDFDIVVEAPSHFCREGKSALKDADAVVERRLRLAVPDSLRGRPLFAFAGLANNAQFFVSLRKEGLEVVGTRSFPDHHRYTADDLAAIRREAAGATIVTTEKDAVKFDAPDIVAIPAEFVMPQEVLDRALAIARSGGAKRTKKRKGAVLTRVEYIAYRAVSRAVTSMSEASIARWGTRLGVLARHVLGRRDRLAMKNLRTVFPERDEKSLRRTLDDCWRHFGREVLLYLQMQNLSLEEVAARCPFVNAELLEESIARGKGTVLISAHWGGWEVAGLAVMALVRNIRTVARPLDNELLERDLQKLRAKTGAEVVDRRKAARVLMRGLAENAVVVLLPDQAVLPREGVLVPFLGRPGWTTPAPAKMALRAGATIVFAFCSPDGLRHRLEFEEPIRADELQQEESDPVALTRRINDVISRRIRERPELWLWMHDRWKGTTESDIE